MKTKSISNINQLIQQEPRRIRKDMLLAEVGLVTEKKLEGLLSRFMSLFYSCVGKTSDPKELQDVY